MTLTLFNSLNKTLGIFVAMLLISGCSSIPVTQDYAANNVNNPNNPLKNYSTYQWLPNTLSTQSNAHELKRLQPFVAQRIENAIMKNLHARGAMLVRYSPEAYISYGYSVKQTQTLEPSTTLGFGFGTGNIGFGTRIPADYETHVDEDATWTVDIYDTSRQLIWRGQAKKSVQNFTKPQEAQAYTQQVIDAILKQYPPK